ncbi:MAG TPA: SPOR domain-containing protein [Humidesulfovibrio sp.]|uniref:SPOR domain-containing protein n=1 Tax=Humidesulfovibrio sp. TaxID=2910988 RepID=UPI002B582857|nr:SPOR domain-containing protein [Humidesulfovibrio sp.]HWR05149.1 SPOR domain-containing protein [Humidesulfovibrio sp.]
MNAPIRIKDPNSSGRQYSFTLGFGGMAVLVTGLTLALCLFFVLGVLVGRGHRPETAVPVVAGIMPRESLAKPMPEVLKPEELGYSEQLGKKHEGPSPSRPIDSSEHKASEKKDAKKDAKQAAEKLADKKAAEKAAAKPAEKPGEKPGDKKDAKAAAKPTEQKAAEKPDPDTRRYDYAYQAATFPDAESAKGYLKRVKSLGLKGDIESGTADGKNWHRVVVFFQGTPTDTRALKEKLASIGAQKLVMRSKTPAN